MARLVYTHNQKIDVSEGYDSYNVYTENTYCISYGFVNIIYIFCLCEIISLNQQFNLPYFSSRGSVHCCDIRVRKV